MENNLNMDDALRWTHMVTVTNSVPDLQVRAIVQEILADYDGNYEKENKMQLQ